MPRLLHDILTDAVRSQPDLELADAAPGDDVVAAAIAHAVDAVILGSHDGHELAVRLLVARPQLAIVALNGDSQPALLYELRRLRLLDPSPASLVDAIRIAVGRARTQVS